MQNLRMGKGNLRAFVCWSGGKDSALSLHRAKIAGIEICCLLNMMAEDGRYSRSHRLSCDILKAQAEAMGIPLVHSSTSWEDYEEKFKQKILELKKRGINTGIFGDIDVQEHKEWVERMSVNTGIRPVLPLWGKNRERLLKDFIKLGFKALIVTTRGDLLDKKWVGREIDKDFIEEVKVLDGIDLCGEKGEYHTFVFAGPVFKKKIKFALGGKVLKDKYYFLEVKPI